MCKYRNTAYSLAALLVPSLYVAEAVAAPEQNWSYSYNLSGQILSADGPRVDVNDTTLYAYSAGNLATITNPLGHTVRFGLYNERGQPGETIDANGIRTLLEYDAAGRLAKRTVKHPSGKNLQDIEFHYVYEEISNKLIFSEFPEGNWESFGYDRAGRLVNRRQSSGDINFTLDALGNRLETAVWEFEDEDGLDERTRYSAARFDELGREIEETGSNGQVTSRQYDPNGNLLVATDAQDQSTSWNYDALNRETRRSAPLAHLVVTQSDASDNTSSVTDPRGLTTAYTYDGLNHRIGQDSPDTGTSTFYYDAAGNLDTEVDARGSTTNYNYDGLNRLVGVTYPGEPEKNITYVYDSGPFCNYCIGRLAGIVDASGTTLFNYDFLGRIVLKTQVVNLPNDSTINLSTRFEYDKNSRLTSITNPNGETITYNWGRPNGETLLPGDHIWSVHWRERESGAEQTLADNIDYDPFGPLKKVRYGNNLILDRQFDLDGRIASQAVTGKQDLLYHYDNRDFITRIEDRMDASRSEQFGYDTLGRLLTADGKYGYITYSYDVAGNRTAKTHDHPAGASQETYTYSDTSNQLETVAIDTDGELSEHSFTYDARGNLILEDRPGDADFNAQYGADNRMDSVAP